MSPGALFTVSTLPFDENQNEKRKTCNAGFCTRCVSDMNWILFIHTLGRF